MPPINKAIRCGRILPSLFITLVIISAPSQCAAYIGPGAGFAFLTSFFFFFIAFALAFFFLLSWPIRYLFKMIKMRKVYGKSKLDRVIVLGMDGLDPDLVQKFIDADKLPNFKRLGEQGSFHRLSTTCPAVSPVAWSSFMTGVNPGKHNIFDFLSREPKTYLPDLSSARVGKQKRTIRLGRYRIPLGKPISRLLRKSKPFWVILGENGIFSNIIRVPITFPPERFHGVLLSAMCAPDLKGSQGTFTHYSDNLNPSHKTTGGVQIRVQRDDGIIHTYIPGPINTLSEKQEELRIPMTIRPLPELEKIIINLQDQHLELTKGNYTSWIRLRFSAGMGIKVQGIARFFLNSIEPHFSLYLSPINIDPEKPALPISHPFSYAVYLSKLIGSYATLGLAEDTWALNEGVIDEDAFLEQVYLNHQEREKMFFNALRVTPKGVVACVFDTTDRVQHGFLRFLEPDHPAVSQSKYEKYHGVIEELYAEMDELLGETMQLLGKKDLLLVMSDHGFKQFRRGVNLNAWLRENGYLAIKDREQAGEWFKGVDWGNTRAYSFGMNGIYLNLKGREGKGIVNPGKEADALCAEIIEKLSGTIDPATNRPAINKVYHRSEVYFGPYTENAPELTVGYVDGYRSSWEGVTGVVSGNVFEDNRKAWGADHCIDPKLVPGVLFSNYKISDAEPQIIDIAPTILALFGVQPPRHIDGKPLKIKNLLGDS